MQFLQRKTLTFGQTLSFHSNLLVHKSDCVYSFFIPIPNLRVLIFHMQNWDTHDSSYIYLIEHRHNHFLVLVLTTLVDEGIHFPILVCHISCCCEKNIIITKPRIILDINVEAIPYLSSTTLTNHYLRCTDIMPSIARV